ncbi:MAG: hypothetical protein MZV63_35790 [Marinilabiliales bacterium]|nr:hypothetical protein [Marinilabiliales bacterium]
MEGDETVTVMITGVSGAPAIAVNAVPATITITDDDLPEIRYYSCIADNGGGLNRHC